MTLQKFRKMLVNMINEDSRFMAETNKSDPKIWYMMHDDEIVVSGDDDSEVFTLKIYKIYED